MITIEEKLRMLQPLLGTMKVLKLRNAYLFEDDRREKAKIENHIDILLAKHVSPDIEEKIILPPPDRGKLDGDIEIGQVEYLNKQVGPFALRLSDINRHVGVFGSTGSGKTTFAKHLIRKLHEKRIPILIFDWEKSYRTLIKEFSDFQVFTVGNDINPLFLNFLTVPPGITYSEYIKSIIAIISIDYIGGIGADTMLLSYMEMAFQETQNPYFEDLKQIIVREIEKDRGKGGKLAGRSGLWKESVSRQIVFMSKGSAGEVNNPRRHYPIEELFSKPIVLEFGGLKSPHDRKFFIHVILNWLNIWNQHNGIQSEKLRQVIIFEEFHNICMKGKEDNMVSSLFRECRKYGIGLIGIDQTPSAINNAIYANMNSKVSFSLGTSQDISAMAKAMNMSSFQSHFLGMLETGQAIINVKQRHHDCFVIRPPFVKTEENIWDEELRKAMKPFKMKGALDQLLSEETDSSHLSQDTVSPSSLDPLEKLFLSNILERPLDGVDERSKRLGIHSSQATNIHTSLYDKGLVAPVYADRKKLFEVTQKGREFAREKGIPIPIQKSRGGTEHLFWLTETAQFLKKLKNQGGIASEPIIEFQDLDLCIPSEGIVIEVETGKSNFQGNLRKLEKSPFPHKFMLATNRQALSKIAPTCEKYPSIKLVLAKQFISSPEELIALLQEKKSISSTYAHPPKSVVVADDSALKGAATRSSKG